jgi:hypothetical protein
MTGLALAINRGFGIGINIFKSQKSAILSLIPIACFATLVTLAFIVFFIG